MGKHGLQREMDSFFRETENEQFSIRKITKGGFSQSRKNLSPEAFLELNDVIVKDFYEQVEYLGYHGHRLVAVDGAFVNLPNHPSIEEEFGVRGMGRGKIKDVEKSMCLLSTLYDPANHMTLDVQCDHMDASETQLLLRHLPKVNKGDILLLDRNYPGKYIFSILKSKGIHFVARMPAHWVAVRKFKASRKQDTEVTLQVPAKDLEKYREIYPGMKAFFTVRLIKIKSTNGQQIILCTSLLNKEKYTREELGEAYHMRWGIEESYKMYKARVQVEAFSGKTAIAVKQDIYAKIMMMSLCAALAFPIEERVIKEYEEAKKAKRVKYGQKINRTYAYWATKGILIGMFLKKMLNKALLAFDQQVAANREQIRPPGEKNKPRKRKPRRHFHMNYKDL